MILDRATFAPAVFKRDNHRCVNCSLPAVDAHHIVDRSLFPDGGYDIDNGVSVCAECHWLAEMTLLSCDDLRRLAKIPVVVLPPEFDVKVSIDKWGNPILSNGDRLPGPMFSQENVQKVLRKAKLLVLFR